MNRKLQLAVILGTGVLLVGACSSRYSSGNSSSDATVASSDYATALASSAAASGASSAETIAAQTQAAADKVIGMPEQQAIATLESDPNLTLTARVVSRDGEDFPITMDYSPNRVNLWIESGNVTQVSVG